MSTNIKQPTHVEITNAPYRSTLVSCSLSVLLKIEPLLPKILFKLIYNLCFNIYRFFLRVFYFFKRFSSSAEKRRMAKAVFRSMPYSLVGSPGLEATYRLAKEVIDNGIKGDFIECGVAQGGSASLLASIANIRKPHRHLWLFDSYEGLPEATEEDYEGLKTGRHVRPLPKGSCLGTIEQVSDLLFRKFGFAKEDVTMVKGWFQDTLPVTKEKIGRISILRLDGDWYESTKVCFEHLYDKVEIGGYIILDDYLSCFGCQKATDEYLVKIGKSFPIQPDGRGGAYFKKMN